MSSSASLCQVRLRPDHRRRQQRLRAALLGERSICQDGELVLIDVAASYANYNADLTRTFPVNGRFTPPASRFTTRCCGSCELHVPAGRRKTASRLDPRGPANDERRILRLGLYQAGRYRQKTLDEPACRKYFMHGLGHPLGLDVHDVGLLNEPFAPGWVLTVEPGIYLPDENFGVRLENDILLTEQGPVDLTAGSRSNPRRSSRSWHVAIKQPSRCRFQ